MHVPRIDVSCVEINGCDIERIEALIQAAIEKALSASDIKVPENSELSVLIAGDKTLKDLNREWRNIDKTTNVLSFPSETGPVETTGEMLLGDLAISIETTQREAELENKAFNDHFSHLVVHGFLHLFGYDHETDEQAELMEPLETRILHELGISDPYESR